ncbi:MAG: hypothetical protein UW11_C0041G0005 [Parcubacteria group bacterium GW2011_GWA2_43_9b]|uniref:Uncharacterized protein n=1 Tax=Candidatus Portnoybacteria bacterium RIFCSPLOWO2_02_FULL_39_11 TaxID=1802001 RepID=A0A1G2FQ89_9BACT|nr:MAG: hypothetical protein UW11_C0041G0005 [Parcubacteria group bacterium GW2011_GWA2_43_9b]OGZ40235.1 MAG: hypothetical protein A3B04_01165 [Candidatus Portnoybacteria bacterium RIFCSPLOWO2_02_FULL_39_11]
MNTKIIIRSVFGIFILLASFAFWSTLSAALNDGAPWLAMSVWSLFIFLILGMIIGLAYLIESEAIFLYGAALAIILPFLFFMKLNIGAAFVLLAFLFLMLAARQANFEKSLRLKFVLVVILRKGLAPTITGFAILSSLIFYGTPLAQTLGESIIVPRPLFNAIARPLINLALQMSVPVGMDIKSLPPEFKKQEVEFLDKMYVSLNQQIEVAGGSFKKWIPLGVAVSLFFTFKVVGTTLSWLMMFFAWLIFRILLWSGVVRINKVVVEKEVIIV